MGVGGVVLGDVGVGGLGATVAGGVCVGFGVGSVGVGGAGVLRRWCALALMCCGCCYFSGVCHPEMCRQR